MTLVKFGFWSAEWHEFCFKRLEISRINDW